MTPMKPRRRPSLALVVALLALVVSLSGTTYAATGGNFILGGDNTADRVTRLTNPQGTALSLTSKAGVPALKVGNQQQIPNLNASQVGGRSAVELMTRAAPVRVQGPNPPYVNSQQGFYALWGGPDHPIELPIDKKIRKSCLVVSYSASNWVSGATGLVAYGVYLYDAQDNPVGNFIDPWFYNATAFHLGWSGTGTFPGVPPGDYTARLRVGTTTSGLSVITDGNDHASLTAIESPGPC